MMVISSNTYDIKPIFTSFLFLCLLIFLLSVCLSLPSFSRSLPFFCASLLPPSLSLVLYRSWRGCLPLERHKAKTIAQIKQFTAKLKRMQEEQNSLQIHTNLATEILDISNKNPKFTSNLQMEQNFLFGQDTDKSSEYIEDCICQKESLFKVMRLMCLQSLTNGGFKPKLYDFYRRELIQTYGFDKALTIENLAKAGLMKQQAGKNAYPYLLKSLNLVSEEEEQPQTGGSPKDISYVYSGYAPLSVRLVQELVQPGSTRSMEEVFKLIPGPTFEKQQKLPPGLKPKGFSDGKSGRQPVTLVFFVGGCTFAEIAAIRFLKQQSFAGNDYVVATTGMINGRTLLESVSKQLDPRVGGIPGPE
eukprot:m.61555 g.61555  ORF g.61555 m.61555 type:complete len:360 (-) comp19285_c0_seq3:221-1300(-)